MRSRKGWMSGWGMDPGNDTSGALVHMSRSGGFPVPVQITELEEGCPEDYIQPGERAYDAYTADEVTVLSQPMYDSVADRWRQTVRSSKRDCYLPYSDRLKRISKTKTYTVTVEASSPEEAAQKLVAEPQLLEET